MYASYRARRFDVTRICSKSAWVRFDRAKADSDQGIGSAVVDLIFSMAKREVTFFSGTAVISRL
jgi:hypothetical protein